MSGRVSLAELPRAGLTLRPAEAAAIVREICRQHDRGELPGIPSAHVVRLTSDGRVVAAGPISPDQPPVVRAAQLLSDLLPPFDAPAPYRAPGGLRLVVARALGNIDLPPFVSLEEFSAALDGFAAPDLAEAARSLFRTWQSSREPPSVTISDVRRARRATGLSLEDVSSATGISVALLRDLEWGDLRQWRNDEDSRGRIVRYARAAGLDEQLVLSVVEPLIPEAAAAPPDEGVATSVALVPSGPQMMVPAIAPPVRRRRRPFSAWSLAVASVVLLAIALTSVLWRPEPPPPVRPPSAVAAIDRPAAPAGPVQAGRTSVRSVKNAGPRRAPAKKTPFLKRELFRIVIR
jgi:hypothetical protein